jgi:hypothetical protein
MRTSHEHVCVQAVWPCIAAGPDTAPATSTRQPHQPQARVSRTSRTSHEPEHVLCAPATSTCVTCVCVCRRCGPASQQVQTLCQDATVSVHGGMRGSHSIRMHTRHRDTVGTDALPRVAPLQGDLLLCLCATITLLGASRRSSTQHPGHCLAAPARSTQDTAAPLQHAAPRTLSRRCGAPA